MMLGPDSLDERVKAFYERQAPAAEWLDRIKASIGRVHRRWAGRPVAIGVAAAVLAGVVWAGFGLFGGNRPGLARQVASEIALNHRKDLPVEFAADAFSQLSAAMPKLGFAPVHPRRVEEAGLRLQGARYCSVAGSIAAQIRLADDAGVVSTLYEFMDDGSFESIGDELVSVDGVSVTLWRERGLIMGLAGWEP